MERASIRTEQFAAAAEGFLQGGCRPGRVQKQFSQAPLPFEGKTNDLRFFYCAARGLASRGYDKIRKRSTLDFRGAFQ